MMISCGKTFMPPATHTIGGVSFFVVKDLFARDAAGCTVEKVQAFCAPFEWPVHAAAFAKRSCEPIFDCSAKDLTRRPAVGMSGVPWGSPNSLPVPFGDDWVGGLAHLTGGVSQYVGPARIEKSALRS
jgi:hypothetical protein